MNSIRDLMTHDHRHCDDLFVAVEGFVGKSDWGQAGKAFDGFRAAMLAHFRSEETSLFPAFEAQTGMTMGPTQVMRSEHEQMRQLIEACHASLVAHDADDYLGYAETLLIMMQQHNLKEENVLYPMCDQHLSSRSTELLALLESGLRDRGA